MMHVSRVFLRWYKSFNIDYTGAGGGDRVVGKRPWNAYDLNSATVELPFVEIPIEMDITTIVGANESGKSHLLSAISHVISGRGIPADPFSASRAVGREFSQTDLCHFALPLTKAAALWPQLGLEFSGLSRDEFAQLTEVDLPKGEDASPVQIFLMPIGEERHARVYHPHSDEPRILSRGEIDELRGILPQTHFINSQLPFSDEVHLGDLLQGYGEPVGDEQRYFDSRLLQDLARRLVELDVPPQSSSPAPKEFLDTIASMKRALDDSSNRRAQQLELEVKLFRDVLGIPRTAIEKLYNLDDDAKGHASALVDKWSEELERTLNLSRYWQQDQNFSIRLKYHKHTIGFEITDKTNRTYTFRERSSGLRYFLSYYIQAKAIEQVSGDKPTIVLMDEPDSFLSIAGQRNLLAVFESLVRSKAKGKLQLVYSTHSPFLIHRNFPRRIRLVRKGDGEEGTQLVDKARERRFEPIRSALGIELSQTLFMGAINIVTEGATDQYFLAEAIRLFAPESAAADLINLNEVVIVSAECASAVYKLISTSQWADEVVPTAIAFLDNDNAGRTEKKRLIGQARHTQRVLDEGSVILVSEILGDLTTDATTEDLVPTDLFIIAIKAYIERWLKDEAKRVEGLDAMLRAEAFAGGHASAARKVFDKLRGTTEVEYDKLGVFESLFDVLSKKTGSTNERPVVATADRELLRKRIVKLCHELRARIESGTKAERQQTGVQAVKRLIGDFFLQHQAAPPATLDLELKLDRLSSEARAFGADEATRLLQVLATLTAEVKMMRQAGRTELSPEDWKIWTARLEAMMRNPLNPSVSASKPTVPGLLTASGEEIGRRVPGSISKQPNEPASSMPAMPA